MSKVTIKTEPFDYVGIVTKGIQQMADDIERARNEWTEEQWEEFRQDCEKSKQATRDFMDSIIAKQQELLSEEDKDYLNNIKKL